MFTLSLKTRYAETDQGGIIHNSAYIIYLENARIDFLQSIGLDINELEKGGTLCPVVSQSVRYVKPLYALQEISIQVWVVSISKVRFFLAYKIFCEGIVVLTGQSEHCFLDRHFKPQPISSENIELLNKYIK